MYIVPNSEVILYENIPLQSDYKITYWFDTIERQRQYFASRTKINLFPYGEPQYRGKFSYIRKNKNSLKVEANIAKLLNCNYMSFTNVDADTHKYEEKTYYAFVEDIRYINNSTTEIFYTIDVMQSYLFDIELKQSFIVRQHEEHDDMYNNLQPENLSTGEYVSENVDPFVPAYGTEGAWGENFSVVIAYNPLLLTDVIISELWGDETWKQLHRDSNLYCNIYQGCEFLVIPMTKPIMDKLWMCIKAMQIATLNGIIAMYIIPTFAIPIQFDPNTETISEFRGRQQNHEISIWHLYGDETNITRKENTFNGYLPHNKKLYTFPYCYLYATNFRGNTEIYKYEYFTYPENSNIISMVIEGNFSLQPSLMLRPVNYKNTGCCDDNVYIASLPSCSWASDKMVDWLAKVCMVSVGGYNSPQYQAEYFSALGVHGQEGGRKKEYNPTPKTNTKYLKNPSINDVVDSLLNPEKDYIDADYTPETQTIYNQSSYYAKMPLIFGETMNGSPNTDIQFGNNLMTTFGIYKMQIKREYAERIDSFFTMYGYAQNKLAIPNIHARQNWTYIQTANCYLHGRNMQFTTEREIEEIFNKGITFWSFNGLSPIGDYSHPENNTELITEGGE